MSQALLVSSAGLCAARSPSPHTTPLAARARGSSSSSGEPLGCHQCSKGRGGVGLKAGQCSVGDFQFLALSRELFPCENQNRHILRQRPESQPWGGWVGQTEQAWRVLLKRKEVLRCEAHAVRWHWGGCQCPRGLCPGFGAAPCGMDTPSSCSSQVQTLPGSISQILPRSQGSPCAPESCCGHLAAHLSSCTSPASGSICSTSLCCLLLVLWR